MALNDLVKFDKTYINNVLRVNNIGGIPMKGALASELEKLRREINRRMRSSSSRNISVGQVKKLQTPRFAYA